MSEDPTKVYPYSYKCIPWKVWQFVFSSQQFYETSELENIAQYEKAF